MEVMVASSLSLFVISGIFAGYNHACQRAEWGAFNVAAQSLAAARFEQTRACRWDRDALTNSLLSTNFPPLVKALDLPVKGNPVLATIYTSIANVTTNPPVKMIQVDCVWMFPRTGKTRTNTVVSYRTTDN